MSSNYTIEIIRLDVVYPFVLIWSILKVAPKLKHFKKNIMKVERGFLFYCLFCIYLSVFTEMLNFNLLRFTSFGND